MVEVENNINNNGRVAVITGSSKGIGRGESQENICLDEPPFDYLCLRDKNNKWYIFQTTSQSINGKTFV